MPSDERNLVLAFDQVSSKTGLTPPPLSHILELLKHFLKVQNFRIVDFFLLSTKLTLYIGKKSFKTLGFGQHHPISTQNSKYFDAQKLHQTY